MRDLEVERPKWAMISPADSASFSEGGKCRRGTCKEANKLLPTGAEPQQHRRSDVVQRISLFNANRNAFVLPYYFHIRTCHSDMEREITANKLSCITGVISRSTHQWKDMIFLECGHWFTMGVFVYTGNHLFWVFAWKATAVSTLSSQAASSRSWVRTTQILHCPRWDAGGKMRCDFRTVAPHQDNTWHSPASGTNPLLPPCVRCIRALLEPFWQ